MLFECHGKQLIVTGMATEINKLPPRKIQVSFQAVAPGQGNASMVVEIAEAEKFQMGDVYELVRKN